MAEIYLDYVAALESHPNFEARKERNVAFDVTVEQYVAYCKERAEDNYTNETQEEAEEKFKKYLALLG